MTEMTNELTQKALDIAVELWRKNLPMFTEKFQSCNSFGGFYKQTDNTNWTTGFCTGELWLCYEYSKDEAFKEAALVQVKSFLERIEKRIEVDHHDMGFLYTPSCMAAYKLTGDETAKKAALMAADCLMERFREKGQFIQAWGELGARDNYRLIIDCLLNLPLLYWASDVTGNPRYREAAVAHTRTSVRHLFRENHSTHHTFYFEPETGEPLRGVTHQGYRDDSAWARGQAWGIYGLALSYRYTKDEKCIELFKNAAAFFLSKLPADFVPYWDLDFEDGEKQPKDSSASAIAACGMMEMANYLHGEEAAYYRHMASCLCRALYETCAVKSADESNGLLLHGVYAKASPYNPVKDAGVDECNTWGDYFYMELLMRLEHEWTPYW